MSLKRPRFKWKRKPKDTNRIFVEVHQNGELLSKTSRPFNKRGQISLTSDPDGELTAPFYPLPSDIQILKITRRGVEVDLDPNWEGFTTFEGKIEDINSDRKSAYTHIMKKGDYGSIAYNDLRILIRIGKDRQIVQQKNLDNSEYKGSLIDLWFSNKNDLKFIGFGAITAFWVVGVFAFALLKHPDDRPREFIDLHNEYTLPFIHPKHLRNVPESLQSQYARNSPIRSAMEFAKDFTDTLLGYDNLSDKEGLDHSIFMQSRLRYKQLYQTQSDEITSIKKERMNREDKYLEDSRTALIALPTVIGESFAGGLLRLEDKLKIWHENASASLKLRRTTSREFGADNFYDFNEYRDPKKQTKNVRASHEKSATPDENYMYEEVEHLANFAEYNQHRITQFREPIVPITLANSSPIGIELVRLFQKDGFQDFNHKLTSIQASIFDPDKPKVIREPLIGSLDPQLIEQTVTRYRFELQLCYELALRRNQLASGSMEWQWHLDTQGKVSEIELIKSSIADTKMIECIRTKITNWKWPRPQKGSIQISYPFHFKPAKG
ncbi:MAG: AgmX/PglI C-terminal domain-containing protein [Proteobacteria bacterium]|nr:AgmX/PglI C-terminal domain-containing protein [Pseudomonadota bacterium]